MRFSHSSLQEHSIKDRNCLDATLTSFRSFRLLGILLSCVSKLNTAQVLVRDFQPVSALPLWASRLCWSVAISSMLLEFYCTDAMLLEIYCSVAISCMLHVLIVQMRPSFN